MQPDNNGGTPPADPMGGGATPTPAPTGDPMGMPPAGTPSPEPTPGGMPPSTPEPGVEAPAAPTGEPAPVEQPTTPTV